MKERFIIVAVLSGLTGLALTNPSSGQPGTLHPHGGRLQAWQLQPEIPLRLPASLPARWLYIPHEEVPENLLALHDGSRISREKMVYVPAPAAVELSATPVGERISRRHRDRFQAEEIKRLLGPNVIHTESMKISAQ